MNKTSACIKMIQILSCRDKVSTNELADILEINPRNISEYIKEIEIAGYTIISEKGRNGGYRLDKCSTLPAVKLTKGEKSVINSGIAFLEKSSDFLQIKDFSLAMGKLMGNYASSNEMTPVTMIDRYPLSIDKNILQKLFVEISNAIDTQTKCEIEYSGSKNKTKTHVIHPYKLFVFNGSWFVLAWNETVNDFGYFKLNRINKIITTRYHFTILKTYSEREYIDSFGMKQNGDYYHVVLELTNLNNVISERIYGKNQIVEEIDEHQTRLICDMQNKQVIKSFVLSFGKNCKVIEPTWLIEEIKMEVDAVKELY